MVEQKTFTPLFPMSLFRTEEWWCTTTDSTEDFDKGSLCVGNIDNQQNGAEKIVTGSFSGMLRIYFPRSRGYRIEDLMVEQSLGKPILQVEIGKFIPSSTVLALAVLHPRQLVVYQIGAMGGAGKSASHYSVVKAYEHAFKDPTSRFTASNMTYGPFGYSNSSKDFLCVQSMDGRLQFFEQDHFAFASQLNNCLIPAPLCYSAVYDSIIVCNTKSEIVAYKYQVLASSSSRKEGSREEDWSVKIGEHASDIFVANYSRGGEPNQSNVIVLGERSLFCINWQGEIVMQKRMDFQVAACRTYCRVATTGDALTNEQENLLLATFSNRILVYRDSQLVWAARYPHTPVSIRVGSFGDVDGFIVSLTEDGRISINYLGKFKSRMFLHNNYCQI